MVSTPEKNAYQLEDRGNVKPFDMKLRQRNRSINYKDVERGHSVPNKRTRLSDEILSAQPKKERSDKEFASIEGMPEAEKDAGNAAGSSIDTVNVGNAAESFLVAMGLPNESETTTNGSKVRIKRTSISDPNVSMVNQSSGRGGLRRSSALEALPGPDKGTPVSALNNSKEAGKPTPRPYIKPNKKKRLSEKTLDEMTLLEIVGEYSRLSGTVIDKPRNNKLFYKNLILEIQPDFDENREKGNVETRVCYKPIQAENCDKGGKSSSEADNPDPNEAFIIHRILKKRTINGCDEFLVKWQGYDKSHNSWEPRSSFLDPSRIVAYEKKKASRKPRHTIKSDPDAAQFDSTVNESEDEADLTEPEGEDAPSSTTIDLSKHSRAPMQCIQHLHSAEKAVSKRADKAQKPAGPSSSRIASPGSVMNTYGDVSIKTRSDGFKFFNRKVTLEYKYELKETTDTGVEIYECATCKKAHDLLKYGKEFHKVAAVAVLNGKIVAKNTSLNHPCLSVKELGEVHENFL